MRRASPWLFFDCATPDNNWKMCGSNKQVFITKHVMDCLLTVFVSAAKNLEKKQGGGESYYYYSSLKGFCNKGCYYKGKNTMRCLMSAACSSALNLNVT